jgi:putative nucleotidyltransferase with HDIG domain
LSEVENKNFSAVLLSSLRPDEPLCFDIYLLINEKYIKYKNSGEPLPTEKYDLFLSKNVSEIYVLTENHQEFMVWVENIKRDSIDEIVERVGDEYEELATDREEIRDMVYQVFAEKDMDPSLVEHLQNNVDSFLNKVTDLKETKKVLAQLTKRNKSLADHSVNVANLAVYLAMVMGFGEQETLKIIYMGGLLHDYGKAKIPAEVLENPQSNLYQQAMEFHPIKGSKAVKAMSFVQEKVATIVEQHHEQYNGKGYPNNLPGEEIFDLAQIISLSNIFDNLCDENSNKSEKEKFKAAIKVIDYDRGKNFNPAMVERCVQSLKLVYL